MDSHLEVKSSHRLIGDAGGVDRKSQHGNVPVEPPAGRRLRKADTDLRSTGNLCLRICQHLGSLLRSDERTAQIPAALDVEAYLQSKPLCLIEGMYEEFPPFFRREKRPGRNIPVASLVVASGIEDHGSVEAFLLHCLKVGGDCLAGHVAVQPPPPAVGAIFG